MSARVNRFCFFLDVTVLCCAVLCFALALLLLGFALALLLLCSATLLCCLMTLRDSS